MKQEGIATVEPEWGADYRITCPVFLKVGKTAAYYPDIGNLKKQLEQQLGKAKKILQGYDSKCKTKAPQIQQDTKK